MLLMTTSEPMLPPAIRRPPTVDDLMIDDGEPMESTVHRDQMFLLIEVVRHHWRDREDAHVGGNNFVYLSPSQVKNHDFRGPDFFAVCGDTTRRPRDAWVVWEEDGRTPDCVVESCRSLGLELGLWRGPWGDADGLWLRFYTPDGDLLPTVGEDATALARAEAERASAEAERAARAEARVAELERRLAALSAQPSD